MKELEYKVINKESEVILYKGTKKECKAFLKGIEYSSSNLRYDCEIQRV